MENEEKTVVCPECGSEEIGKRPNGGYFCRNCGADVVVAVCPECGSNDIGKKYNGGYFCRNCGGEVSSCRQCGSFEIKKGNDGVLFCRNCGAKLGTAAAAKDAIMGGVSAGLSGIRTASKKFENAVENKVVSLPNKEGIKKKTAGIGKEKIKSLSIAAVIALVAVILTLIFVKSNCSLVNEWAFGVNTYKFNNDGTFSANLNTINNNGTYTTDGDKITLKYSFMGLMEKETELTYSISGKTMTLAGDVTLLGVGSTSLDFECTSSSGNGWLKIVLVIAEIVVASLAGLLIVKKENKDRGEKSEMRKTPNYSGITDIQQTDKE